MVQTHMELENVRARIDELLSIRAMITFVPPLQSSTIASIMQQRFLQQIDRRIERLRAEIGEVVLKEESHATFAIPETEQRAVG